MPIFQVTVADEAGHKLYDESIEAAGPMEACAKAVADAATANVAEAEEAEDPMRGPFAAAGGDHSGDLREEDARLAAETADGELSADEVAAKVRRKAEVRAEMEHLGIGAPLDQREATTYRDPN